MLIDNEKDDKNHKYLKVNNLLTEDKFVRSSNIKTPFLRNGQESNLLNNNSNNNFNQRHNNSEKNIREKKSVGIICRRINANRDLEIMMVCRRCTYSFDMFMQGNYNSNNSGEILIYLDGMTTNEKIILLSFNFEIVWYYWWLDGYVRSKLYFEIKNKYEKLYIDGGIRLRKLIEKSKDGAIVWEIPKGRRKHGEEMIHGAIREFEEESGMKKSDYRFIKKAPIILSFVDCGVKYTTTYFIADAINVNNIKVQFGKDTIGEISEVRFMSLNDIKIIDQFSRITSIFNKIK